MRGVDAEQGKCEAQFEIGEYYEKGSGVTQDFARAVEWYRKAAAQRHGMAIKYLEQFKSEGKI
jgi:TPR repeat protein